MFDRSGDATSGFRPHRPLLSVADIIATTMCEFDGRNWLELDPWLRGRYVRAAVCAQDRIKRARDEGAITRE